MSTKKKIAVYIGRFQPFHAGHLSVILKAKKDFDGLLVLCGSSGQRRSPKNPFTDDERSSMILPHLDDPLCAVGFIRDYLYQEHLWKRDVMSQVSDFILNRPVFRDAEISIVGYEKDDSSYYLKQFPQWKFHEYDPFLFLDDTILNATEIRNHIFESGSIFGLPTSAVGIVNSFINSDDYSVIQDEFKYYTSEKEKFKDYPYPETLKFLCADSIVTCAGYVLLVERKFAPGKGCYALPGGFVNQKESLIDCAIRELYEETNLKVPMKVLQGSFKSRHIFDSPSRSLGIPRVTTCHHFDIEPDASGALPRIKAGDDAARAWWFDLDEVRRMSLYDDHMDIVEYFVGR